MSINEGYQSFARKRRGTAVPHISVENHIPALTEVGNVTQGLDFAADGLRLIHRQSKGFFSDEWTGNVPFDSPELLYFPTFAGRPHIQRRLDDGYAEKHDHVFGKEFPRAHTGLTSHLVYWLFQKNGESFDWPDFLALDPNMQEALIEAYSRGIKATVDGFRKCTNDNAAMIVSGAVGYSNGLKMAQSVPTIHAHILAHEDNPGEEKSHQSASQNDQVLKIANFWQYATIQAREEIGQMIECILADLSPGSVLTTDLDEKRAIDPLRYRMRVITDDPIHTTMQIVGQVYKHASAVLSQQNLSQPSAKELGVTRSLRGKVGELGIAQGHMFKVPTFNWILRGDMLTMSPSLHGPGEQLNGDSIIQVK